MRRSRGRFGGGSRGGRSWEGDDSEESDETGVAEPHENLSK